MLKTNYFKSILLAIAVSFFAVNGYANPFTAGDTSVDVIQKSSQIRSAMSAMLSSEELSVVEEELSSQNDDVRLTEVKLAKTLRIPGEAPEIHFLIRLDSKKGTQYGSNSYLVVLRLQKVALGPATTGLAFVVQSMSER